VTLKDNDEFQELSDEEVSRLFDRFSLPIVRPCITPRQKQNAVGIAKILWLRLITGTDTEEHVYQDLKSVLGDKHDSNVAVGSMYFFKMKTALTEDEICRLQNHFSHEVNFNRLKGWGMAGGGTV
jgi:hypothetical protein